MSLEAVLTGVAFVAGVLAILAAVFGSSRRLSRRIDALDEKLTARIDAVDAKAAARSDAVEAKAAARSDALEHKLDAVDAKAAARSDALEAKPERYHDELVEFRIETKESFGRVEAHLARHDERLALWERFVWARSNAMPEPDAGRPRGADLPQVEPQKSA